MARPDTLFRVAFEQAASALAVVDGRGQLAIWNGAFDTLFRKLAATGPERLRTSLFDFVSDREGSRFDYYAAELLLGGRSSARVESPIRAADGSRLWLSFVLSLLEAGSSGPSASGSERFLLCRIEEVTDRVDREKRLIEAKEEAEKATHTKSLFLANMSHEIRTPIQTILGVVELLQETALDGEQSEYAAQVRFSADVLLGLINDILDFSKIEADKLDLETTDFELRALVHQSVDLLVMDAHRKGLEVIVDVDESLPALLRGDPARLRQIIVNLFKNAVKFTAEGDISLILRRVLDGGGSRIRFEVLDSGIGVPEELIDRLFTPFFQADFAAARKAGGTGLGLAISRRLVELMGGRIGVAQNEVKGSLFWFEVPLVAAENQPEPLPCPRAPAGARVLIVDDHAGARAFALRAASAAGYRVAEASSGEEALGLLRAQAAKGEPFTLCLIDQNMPKMDGWRLASEITGDTAINGVRLLLLVPEGTMGAEAKMKLLRWFNAYVSKPLRPELLLEGLARALSADVDLPAAGSEGSEEDGLIPVLEEAYEAEVLIAEDHEVNRELFTLILSRLGCKVTTARDGAEALEIGSARQLAGRPFDIVLMDIFMPRMNGYEASAALREKGYRGPIIAVTASALKGERDKCIAAGMDAVLVKPFKKKDLSAVLGEWLPPENGGNRVHGAALKPPPRMAASQPSRKRESESGPTVDESSIFDWEGVLDTFLGQRETVLSLLKRFTEKAETQQGELEEALGAKDWIRFREVAHSLKGASWNLAAGRLGDAALAAETAGKNGDDAAAEAALDLLGAALRDFGRVARKRLSQG